MGINLSHAYLNQGASLGYSIEKIESLLIESYELIKSGFPPLFSLNHLAKNSDVDFYNLRKVIQRKCTDFKYLYDIHKIPKRSGGFRFIHSPGSQIKRVQRWINECILYNSKPHWRCFSFHPGGSILDCASIHCESKWLIKIDIERFFDSITEKQVYEVFVELGYKPLISFELARICTVNHKKKIKKHYYKKWVMFNTDKGMPYKKDEIKTIGYLPQGAPTSPQLSNLVFKKHDEHIFEVAKKNDLQYTRYADDMTFSTVKKNFSREKAVTFVKELYSYLSKYGFSPNHTKLKIVPPGAHKVVLGLNVNSNTPRLSRVFKNRVENHLRCIEKYGLESHRIHIQFNSIFALIDHIRGLINYALQIDTNYGHKLSHRYLELLRSNGF
ncbi:reverse transcriptase family protein [Marinicella sediminis]|uniref:RNA-directed DNA polymerase n=1 Tax=Marinicella sediminis TaxID=1792834 RepID=A0ABV7J6M0_9GAMM|nr:reverse transcriptase family protein [Marinicella sediminis]